MQIERRVGKSMSWPGDVYLLSSISEFRADFSARIFYEICRARTETEKALFLIIFLRHVFFRVVVGNGVLGGHMRGGIAIRR